MKLKYFTNLEIILLFLFCLMFYANLAKKGRKPFLFMATFYTSSANVINAIFSLSDLELHSQLVFIANAMIAD